MSDYISREADGDDFVRRADIVEKFMDRLPSISVGYLCKVADEIPPADVRPVVKGEWMMMVDSIFNGERFVEWTCSECGYVRNRGWRHTDDGKEPDAKFCENCGADMTGGADG